MIFLLAALSLHVSAPWHTRSEFYTAFRKIKPGASEAQVRALVGKPDDLWPKGTSQRFGVNAREEGWSYGADRHLGMPTLGLVIFEGGKVKHVWPQLADVKREQWPLAPKGVSETGFRTLLRAMHVDPRQQWLRQDPAMFLRVANLLWAVGKDRALSVMLAFEQLPTGWRSSDDSFWILRAFLEPKKPEGYFPVPAVGGPAISPPKDMRTFPTYPVVLVQDIPFSLWRGADLGGFPEPFAWYVRDHRNEWKLRSKPLSPPDDPFPAFKLLLKNKYWLDAKAQAAYLDLDQIASDQLLTLIRTVYRPVPTAIDLSNPKDYDSVHQTYLKLGGHWDARRQMYVRGDGSVLTDEFKLYAQYEHRFTNIPRHQVKVEWERDSDTSVTFGMDVEETGNGKIASCYLAVEDVATGEELFGAVFPSPSQRAKDKALREPPHVPTSGSTGSGFSFTPGHQVRFVFEFKGKKYKSPAFKL